LAVDSGALIETPMVCPSVALAIASVPMVPPAPGRFSTTKGWPKTDEKWFAAARPAVSGVEPGGNGTMTRTGRSGHAAACCARTREAARTGAAALKANNARRGNRMSR
jgi:hypothetical protein